MEFLEEKEPVKREPLSHVVDFYNRYPGEEVTFFTSVGVDQQTFSSLTVLVPVGCEMVSYHGANGTLVRLDSIRRNEQGTLVTWCWEPLAMLPDALEFSITAKVMPLDADHWLVSEAVLMDENGVELVSESVQVTVKAKGAFLNHLPEIYAQDDFMGRYLMLFESFWKPISNQIQQSANYFDIDLTPKDFLPWLASWIGVTWKGDLPEERQRQLLHRALSIYQRRGTKQALVDYLGIYTAGKVRIEEHHAFDFILGENTQLGPTLALGKDNQLYAFTVHLEIHESEIEREYGKTFSEKQTRYHRKISAIIESQKPAHTAFELRINILPDRAGQQALTEVKEGVESDE
jgi:phage tail-like protein